MYTSAGLGDMAVSNTIGSNVFDILVGLGVPWGIQTMAVNFGTVVSVTLFLDKYNWMKRSINVNVKKKKHDGNFNYFALVAGENQQ